MKAKLKLQMTGWFLSCGYVDCRQSSPNEVVESVMSCESAGAPLLLFSHTDLAWPSQCNGVVLLLQAARRQAVRDVQSVYAFTIDVRRTRRRLTVLTVVESSMATFTRSAQRARDSLTTSSSHFAARMRPEVTGFHSVYQSPLSRLAISLFFLFVK